MAANICIVPVILLIFVLVYALICYSPSISGWFYPWARRNPKSFKYKGLRDFWSIRYRIVSYYNNLPDNIFRKYWIPYSLVESVIITFFFSVYILYKIGSPPPDILAVVALILIFFSIVPYILVDRALMREYEKYRKRKSK